MISFMAAVDDYLPRTSSPWPGVFVAFALLFVLYVYENDRKLALVPAEALRASPVRLTEDAIHEAASRVEQLGPEHPILNHLPPQTHRRYIVIGGSGLVGGWIVLHLIHRGEDPKYIRILDLRAPARSDLKNGRASLVDFVPCDISNSEDVTRAFTKAWPDNVDAATPLTVFHTAANIRFYERHPSLLSRSAKVNVAGTQNVIAACELAGASVLVYTSSASVSVRSTRFLLWPWETQPQRFVQSFSDEDPITPMKHEDYFANYAATKMQAEKLVRDADQKTTNGVTLRTGIIRPGNGVYGPGGDILCGAFLVRQVNPTWIYNVVENFCSVETVSASHLCYEQRLVELLAGTSNPDIGGQSFIVTDPGPPPTYSDVYLTLSTLTNGETMFPRLSATAMLLLAHIVESVYLLREFLTASTSKVAQRIGGLVPRITGDFVNLQPSLWNLVIPHLLFDDQRARASPERGGLGLTGGLPTLESLCLLVTAHRQNVGKGETCAQVGAPLIRFGLLSMGKRVVQTAP